MRLKYEFELMNLDDCIVAVPVGHSATEVQSLIKLNKTSAFVLELLKTDITEEEIIRAIENRFHAAHDTISNEVHSFLALFRERDLLL